MDLLKNLLFMHAKGQEFTELKSVWKALTDEIYAVNEKPLRFSWPRLISTANYAKTQFTTGSRRIRS